MNDTLPEEKGSNKTNKETDSKIEAQSTTVIEDDSTDDTGEDLWSEVLNEKSDAEKCRNNWSKGVQNTEDFFAGKGHSNRETKSKSSPIKETVEKPKVSEQPIPVAPQVNKPKEKPKEEPKKEKIEAKEEKATPRVPIGDCVVCDRSAKAICSGKIRKEFCDFDINQNHKNINYTQ